MKKRLVALLLTTVMIVSCLAGCGQSEDDQKQSQPKSSTPVSSKQDDAPSSQEPESEWPEYLNMDSAYPIVKDEYADDITLTLTIVQPDAFTGKWDETWLFTYLKEKYNLNFDVQVIPEAAMAERKGVLLNTGSTTDLMWMMKLTTQEMAKYGEVDQLFLPMDEYISEELTPGIHYWLYGEGGRSDARMAVTQNDGHIYTLPQLVSLDSHSPYYKIFMNQKYLDKIGAKAPATLDEFIDVLYQLKEKDPAGVGSENFYPFGGGLTGAHAGYYILNALGYMTTQSSGQVVTVRDGEVVIPAYDTEVFQEYLKIMRQFVEDGIVAPNFVTMTLGELDAQMLKNQTALYYSLPFLSGDENFLDWEAISPLTSQWNDKAEWFAPKAVNLGNFVISADTEYPELCMRVADIFFNTLTDDPRASLMTSLNPDYYYGFEPAYVYDEKNQELISNPNLPNGMTGDDYRNEIAVGYNMMWGTMLTPEAEDVWRNSMGWKYKEVEIDPTSSAGEYCYYSMKQNVIPYATGEVFPYFYYLTNEQTKQVTDLTGVIEPHIKQEVARFINGDRPITEDELAKFRKELEDMDIQVLLDIYKEIFDTYKANQ